MCLAIYKPKRKRIPIEHLKNGFLGNSDGAGVAWIEGGEIHTIKACYKTFEEFLPTYLAVEHRPCVVHFRWSTHGSDCADNCHPFLVNDRFAVAHNGIMPKAFYPTGKDDRSDTRVFIDSALSPLLAKFDSPRDPHVRTMVESMIGAGNKIIVLDKRDGNATIYNQDLGIWEDGVWYSNGGFRSYQTDLFSFRDSPLPAWRSNGNAAATAKAAQWEYNSEWYDVPDADDDDSDATGDVDGIRCERCHYLEAESKIYWLRETDELICTGCAIESDESGRGEPMESFNDYAFEDMALDA